MTASNVVRRTGRCTACKVGRAVMWRPVDDPDWRFRCNSCDTQDVPPRRFLSLVPPIEGVTGV